MAHISQVESGPFSGFDHIDDKGKQTKSQRRDIVFLLLSALAIGALVLMVALGSLLLLQAALLQAKLRIAGLPQSMVWLMQWRNGLAVIVVLLLLATICFALSRERAARNRARWRQHASRTIAVIRSQSLPDDLIEQSNEAPLVSLTEKRPDIAPGQFNDFSSGSEFGSGANVAELALAAQSAQTVTIRNSGATTNSMDITSAPTVTLATTGFLTLFGNADFAAETLEASATLDVERAEAERAPLERARIVAPFHVNLRVDPQSNAEVLDLLEPGTEVTLLSRLEHDDGVVWRQVEFGKQGGWLVNSFLQPLA